MACVSNWSRNNFLKLNPAKCKVMIFSKSPIDLNIRLESELLEIVPYYKTLGVILDDKLTFSQHINFVISRISWVLRRLYNTAFYLPSSVRRKVAMSLCLPLLNYGIEIYSCTTALNMDRLRICFNRVIRYIFKIRFMEHVSNRQKDLLGCSFEQYIKLRLTLFFYKTIKYGCPVYLVDKFSFGVSNRTHSLVCPAYASLMMERSFSIKIVRIWNTVPYQNRRFNYTLPNFKNIFLSHL